jgi:hypothetical protein
MIALRRDDDWRTLEDFLRLGVAITRDMGVRDYHAVTVVRLDQQLFILDVDGPPRHRGDNYRFLFSINENGIWDHALVRRDEPEAVNSQRRRREGRRDRRDPQQSGTGGTGRERRPPAQPNVVVGPPVTSA